MRVSTRFVIAIVVVAFMMLGSMLYYAYDQNRRMLLEKINTNQHVQLQNIANAIRVDMLQLQDELHFLVQLESFNDLLIDDLDKRILAIIHHKKQSQKFPIELRVYDLKGKVIAQTSSLVFHKERGIILQEKVVSTLQKNRLMGKIELFVPYLSLGLYFPKNHQFYRVLSPQNNKVLQSNTTFVDGTHVRVYRFDKGVLDGFKIESSLSKSQLDAVLYSLWSYSAIIAIVLVSLLLLLALYYSVRLHKQRETLQKIQLQLLEEATHLAQVKSRFISQMSHEFRTPLNSIIGFSQFLSQEKLVDKEYENLPLNVEKAGKHLLSLVDNILALSQEEALPQESINKSILDLVPLTQEVISIMSVQSRKKGLELHFETSDKSLFQSTNKHTYQQILFNIIENAIKYTDKGSIKVSLQQEGKKVILSVKDTGIGMEEMQTIFQAFVRLKSAQSVKGTGLGLALVEAYVTKLEGKIEVQSRGLGHGSTFIITWIQEDNNAYINS